MNHCYLSKRAGLALLWLLALPFALSSSVDPRPAIGFDLGQSYGTAVAHLPNGTIIRLAKVEGSPSYRAFMQSELQKQREPGWYYSRSEIRAEDRLSGAAILAEMLAPLRSKSEAVLGAPLPATVVITAPYMLAWQHDETEHSSFVGRARILAGLRPIIVDNMDSVYLGEANTILAAAGRSICPDRRCNGPEWSDEAMHTYDVVYLISFTNKSLYTAFQVATCFTLPPSGARLRTINPEFGLDQGEGPSGRESFWRGLEEYLASRVAEYADVYDGPRESFLVVVAGEAADHPDFMDAVRKTVAEIEKVPAHGVGATGTGPEVELVVPEDPTYAAAIGVAFWRRTMIDSSYCRDYAKHGGVGRHPDWQSVHGVDHDEL